MKGRPSIFRKPCGVKRYQAQISSVILITTTSSRRKDQLTRLMATTYGNDPSFSWSYSAFLRGRGRFSGGYKEEGPELRFEAAARLNRRRASAHIWAGATSWKGIFLGVPQTSPSGGLLPRSQERFRTHDSRARERAVCMRFLVGRSQPRRGGGEWESNPPIATELRHTGFEDQESHQTLCASGSGL